MSYCKALKIEVSGMANKILLHQKESLVKIQDVITKTSRSEADRVDKLWWFASIFDRSSFSYHQVTGQQFAYRKIIHNTMSDCERLICMCRLSNVDYVYLSSADASFLTNNLVAE